MFTNVIKPESGGARARVAARVAFAVVVARVAAVAVARVTARVAAHVAAHVTAAVASRVAATVAVPVGATATARVATQCVCVVVFFFAEFTTFIELERVLGKPAQPLTIITARRERQIRYKITGRRRRSHGRCDSEWRA